MSGFEVDLPVEARLIMLVEDPLVGCGWENRSGGPVGRPAIGCPGVVLYSGIEQGGTARVEVVTLPERPEESVVAEAAREGWVVYQEFSTRQESPWLLCSLVSAWNDQDGQSIPVMSLSGNVRVRLLACGRDDIVEPDSPPSRECFRVVIWAEPFSRAEVRSEFNDYVSRGLDEWIE